MADARRVIVALLVVLAVRAHAAAPCEEGRGQTGLAVAVVPAGGLAVTAVDGDSAAAGSGVAVGDAVVQVNGVVPRGCGDWARALREARRAHTAVLLLVRRDAVDLPLVLGAATWERAVAVAVAPPPEPPSVKRLVAVPPPPLPPETGVSLEEVIHGLDRLAAADRPSARLPAYRGDLVRVERQIETLAARRSVPADVVEGLRTVVGYYDAAGVAWASEETERERERRPRHVPTREAATAPYFEDSDVAATIDRFPFLRDTVVREPGPGLVAGESAGLWRPRQARGLLWERGREELARLSAWLAASGK